MINEEKLVKALDEWKISTYEKAGDLYRLSDSALIKLAKEVANILATHTPLTNFLIDIEKVDHVYLLHIKKENYILARAAIFSEETTMKEIVVRVYTDNVLNAIQLIE